MPARLEAIGGSGGSSAKQHAPGGKPTLSGLAPTSEDYSGKLTDWAPAHGPNIPERWKKKKKSRKREFSKMRRIF